MSTVQPIGRAGFPAVLLENHLLSRNDLAVAEQHATREHMELAETLIALGLVPEEDCYRALAKAAGPGRRPMSGRR